ncbi:hypothetical protein A6R68_19308, partial [Neotoma lepida]
PPETVKCTLQIEHSAPPSSRRLLTLAPSARLPHPPVAAAGTLLCSTHLVQPLPLEGHCHTQQDGDDAGEVDIADDLGAYGARGTKTEDE